MVCAIQLVACPAGGAMLPVCGVCSAANWFGYYIDMKLIGDRDVWMRAG